MVYVRVDDSTWLCMTVHDCAWLRMAVHECPCPPAKTLTYWHTISWLTPQKREDQNRIPPPSSRVISVFWVNPPWVAESNSCHPSLLNRSRSDIFDTNTCINFAILYLNVFRLVVIFGMCTYLIRKAYNRFKSLAQLLLRIHLKLVSY
jgi:hypothetical protein